MKSIRINNNKASSFRMFVTLALTTGLLACQSTEQSKVSKSTSEMSKQALARAVEYMPHNLNGKLKNRKVEPNWLKAHPHLFWYESETDGQSFYLVDTKDRTQRPLFDKLLLARGISAPDINWQDKPLNRVSFEDKNLAFSLDGKAWQCDLSVENYSCTPVASMDSDKPAFLSPDGRHYVKRDGFNLVLCQLSDVKHESSENRETTDSCLPLTKDGTESRPYGATHAYPEQMMAADFDEVAQLELSWSPDGRYAITHRLNRAGVNRLTLTDSVADNDFAVQTVEYYYPQAGDQYLPQAELVLVDTQTQTAKLLDVPPVMQTYYGGPLWGHWHKGAYYYHDRRRGNRTYFIRKVLPAKAEVITLIEETDPEFIDPWVQSFRNLMMSERLIWTSQRTGYQHLYLYDSNTGRLLNPITSGQFTVRVIRGVDEKNGVVYFEASGREPGRDPYLRHLYRVNLDGSNLVLLTPEAMEHDTRISPDYSVFTDTYSGIQTAPVSVLRRTDTGDPIMTLQHADASALEDLGWQPPEPFRVLAEDNKTWLYGLMYKPSHFDANKRYPIIDDTYTGPHNFFTPKSFVTFNNQRPALAELGFILIKMDGRGTNKRGKAFHRYSYKSLASGTDDHVWAIKELAKTRPYMDVDRVGIFGFSAGGYDTVQAMLRHPEFFKVGVSASGNHEFRVDKAGWNEIWMGWPMTQEWKEQSNLYRVDRLKGKLLLAHGELDSNVHPSATMRLVDKLIDANKDFDLLIMPKMGHVLDEHPYWVQKRWRYFLAHLKAE